MNLFEQTKIITPQISLGCNMFLDLNNNYHNTKGYSFIKKEEVKEDYKYFLTILNSNIMWFFIKNTSDVLRGGYYSFTTDYLEPFPIPKLDNIEQQKPFVDKADQIIELTNSFEELKSNFVNWLVDNLNLQKHKSKFDSTYKLKKEELIEKLKELKVDLSDMSLYSNIVKNHVSLVKAYNELQSLEDEINQMVYKLYDLNSEDIKIIEEDISK